MIYSTGEQPIVITNVCLRPLRVRLKETPERAASWLLASQVSIEIQHIQGEKKIPVETCFFSGLTELSYIEGV